MAEEGLGHIQAAAVSYKQSLRLDANYASALQALKRLRPKEAANFARTGSFEEGEEPYGHRHRTHEAEPGFGERMRDRRAESEQASSSVEGPYVGSHAMEWGEEALATPFQRCAAFLLDGFLIGLLARFLNLFGFGSGAIGGLFLLVLYESYAIYEYGTTLGKDWMNLSVDGIDGSGVTLSQSVIRAVVKGVSHSLHFLLLLILMPHIHASITLSIVMAILAFPAFPSISELFIFINPRRQALHDLAARTVVSR
jgi:uncharacterized RDD family membrane protein YckC